MVNFGLADSADSDEFIWVFTVLEFLVCKVLRKNTFIECTFDQITFSWEKSFLWIAILLKDVEIVVQFLWGRMILFYTFQWKGNNSVGY